MIKLQGRKQFCTLYSFCNEARPTRPARTIARTALLGGCRHLPDQREGDQHGGNRTVMGRGCGQRTMHCSRRRTLTMGHESLRSRLAVHVLLAPCMHAPMFACDEPQHRQRAREKSHPAQHFALSSVAGKKNKRPEINKAPSARISPSFLCP